MQVFLHDRLTPPSPRPCKSLHVKSHLHGPLSPPLPASHHFTQRKCWQKKRIFETFNLGPLNNDIRYCILPSLLLIISQHLFVPKFEKNRHLRIVHFVWEDPTCTTFGAGHQSLGHVNFFSGTKLSISTNPGADSTVI